MSEQISTHIAGYAESLREHRRQIAEKTARWNVYSMLSDADRIAQPTGTIVKMDPELPTYIGHLSPEDLMVFEGLGEKADVFAGKVSAMREGDRITLPLTDGTKLDLKKQGELALQVVVRLATSTKLVAADEWSIRTSLKVPREATVVRYQKSPGHQALHKAVTAIDTSVAPPEYIEVEAFEPFEDALGTLQLLGSLGCPVDTYFDTSRRLAGGMTIDQILHRVLSDSAKHSAAVADETQVRLQWGFRHDSVAVTMLYDSATNQMGLSFQAVPEKLYAERANQSTEIGIPFVETKCFAEMSELLGQNGLRFNPMFEIEMLSIEEAARFGSVYTQLSREIARWVNDPRLVAPHKLFVPESQAAAQAASQYEHTGMAAKEYMRVLTDTDSDSPFADIDTQVKSVLETVSVEGLSEPAMVLLTMAKEALAPRSGSELPVTTREVNIHAKACFDVAGYYLGGVRNTYGKGVLPYQENGVALLEKHPDSGGHTFLLTRETLFNGVNLPKGSLMSKLGDRRWAFQRLTPFTFDNPDDAAVFSTEIRKAAANELRDRTIGVLSMFDLVTRAKARSNARLNSHSNRNT